MSISGIRDNIKTALGTIPGLMVYDTVPDSLVPPCAIIIPTGGDYDLTASAGTWMPSFEIIVFVLRAGSPAEGQDSLDGYMEPTGTSSVKAAVESGTYTGNASDVRISGFRDYGGRLFGATLYLAVTFDCSALV